MNQNNTNSLFGQTPATGSGSLFGSTPSKEGDAKPAFSFGGAQSAFGASTPSFGAKTTETKPAFAGFGANTPISKPATSSIPSFGGASSTNNEAPKLGFGFGDQSKSGGFSFGSAAGSKPEENKAPTSFSLNSTGENKQGPVSTSAPSFSFGKSGENKSTFSFGAPKTEEPKSAVSSKPFSFGAKPEEKKETSGGFSFGAKPEVKKEGSTGFSFGGSKAEEKKEGTTGFSFGAKPEEKKESTGGFSFGAKTEEKKADSQSTAPSFSFGAKPEEKKDESKPATTGGFSFGVKTEEKKDDSDKEKKTVSFTNSVIDRDEKKETAKTVEPEPISLNNKTLEDLITKWTNQLTKASASYQSYSSKINEWDRVLVDGGDKITQLYKNVTDAEQTQSKIDQSLLYIERQQTELETFLDNYEPKAESLLNDVLSSNNQQRDTTVVTNDQKREQAYHTAELLDENLNALGLNLSSLITEINEVSESFNKANGLSASDTSKEDDENSLNQIVKLLNTHLDSLQYIERNSEELKSKVDQFKNVQL